MTRPLRRSRPRRHKPCERCRLLAGVVLTAEQMERAHEVGDIEALRDFVAGLPAN